MSEKLLPTFISMLGAKLQEDESTSLQETWYETIAQITPKEKMKFRSGQRCRLEEIVSKVRDLISNEEIDIPKTVTWLDQKLNKYGGILQKNIIMNLNIHQFKLWLLKIKNWTIRKKRKEMIAMEKQYNSTTEQRINQMTKKLVLQQAKLHEKSPNISGIKDDGKIYRDPKNIKAKVQEVFSKRFESRRKPPLNDKIIKEMARFYKNDHSKQKIIRSVNIVEVIQVIKNIPETAPGWDLMSSKIMKYIVQKSTYEEDPGSVYCDVILEKLTTTINEILEGQLHKDMRRGIVYPIFKPKIYSSEDLFDLQNFRPINVLPLALRIANRFVTNWLMEFLLTHEILSDYQFGFIRGRNTIQLYTIIKSILEISKMKDESIAMMFIDFSDAYTSLEWDYLHQIAETMKLPLDIRNYFRLLYTDITMQVITEFGLTSQIEVTKGIMMGDPMSPLVFAIFIDPLLRYMNSCKTKYLIEGVEMNTCAYADDIVLIDNSIRSLQNKVKKFDLFSKQLGLEINTKKGKTEYLSFTKSGRKSKSSIQIAGKRIYQMKHNECYKYLGFCVNYAMTDVQNSNLVKNKVKQALNNIMWNFLDVRNIRMIIQTLAMSTAVYSLQMKTVDDNRINEIEATISGVVKKRSKLNALMSKEVVYLPIKYGGLQYLDLKTLQDKLFIKNIVSLYNSSNLILKKIIQTNIELSSHNQDMNSIGNKWIQLKKIVPIVEGKNNKQERLKYYSNETGAEKFALVTDGSFLHGKGGGSMILYKDNTNIENVSQNHILKEEKYQFEATDAARAELQTILIAITKIPYQRQVNWYCDCKYALVVMEYINNLEYWIKRMKNVDLIIAIHSVLKDRRIKLVPKHVKAHCGIWINEKADTLAKEGRDHGILMDNICEIAKHTQYYYPNTSNAEKAIGDYYTQRRIERLKSKDIDLENSATIYQLSETEQLVDVQNSLHWTKHYKSNIQLYYYYVKAQMDGMMILQFGNMKECKCEEVCSKEHWFLKCPMLQYELFQLQLELSAVLLKYNINRMVKLNWNLKDATNLYEQNWFPLDPRGIFCKTTIQNIETEKLDKIIDEIQEKLYKFYSKRLLR